MGIKKKSKGYNIHVDKRKKKPTKKVLIGYHNNQTFPLTH